MVIRSPRLSYFAGLDLGRSHEFTALAVVERSQPAGSFEPEDMQYAVRHLERFPPGTSYPTAFSRLVEVFATKPLAGAILVADQTAVGRPVVESLRHSGVRATVIPLTLTVGHAAHRDDRGLWLVPRTELVGVLQILLQSGRLKVADALPEAAMLVRELENFRAEVPKAVEDAVAWREGTHDDLVLAVAIAAWEGERHGPTSNSVPQVYTPRALRPWGR
jgi:hypothetical protein